MKVNMALISETDKGIKDNDEAVEIEQNSSNDEKEIDESDKHSKLKTVILIAAMACGFLLFVWNMIHLVNNMRLDNQGSATSIVYEADERIGDFMGSDGSGSIDVADVHDQPESEVSTDAARDGPGSEDERERPTYANESDEMAALRQERDDAKNNEELMRRQLKNAEDMLDSSLQREADLQKALEGRTSVRN